MATYVSCDRCGRKTESTPAGAGAIKVYIPDSNKTKDKWDTIGTVSVRGYVIALCTACSNTLDKGIEILLKPVPEPEVCADISVGFKDIPESVPSVAKRIGGSHRLVVRLVVSGSFVQSFQAFIKEFSSDSTIYVGSPSLTVIGAIQELERSINEHKG